MHPISILTPHLHPSTGLYAIEVRLAPALLSALLLLCALVHEGSGAVTDPGSGCATCGGLKMDSGMEEKFLIELAKKQILSKLHMRDRPNITQTLPRAALATALRKLHAGRVKTDGTLELDSNLGQSPVKDQAYEIVSFAEMGKRTKLGRIWILNITWYSI